MSRKGCASATVAGATLSLVVCLATVGAQAPPTRQQPVTIFGVGDIMHCATPYGAEITGRLMERLLDETPNSIGITLGDNSNDDGSEGSYNCLDQTAWGRLFSRLYPTPGNHDYFVDKDLPYYYLYFPNARPVGQGYYAFNAGGWRLYAINTELTTPESRQRQLEWLEADLRSNHDSKCTLAYFHRPPFSSGRFASPAWALPIFTKLYKWGVDLALAAHEHFFASLPPLNPAGVVDGAYGVPMLIAGTGGAAFFERPRTLKWGRDGEEILARTLGVLKVTLTPGRYEWAFVGAQPAAVRMPSGTGLCHDNPSNVR